MPLLRDTADTPDTYQAESSVLTASTCPTVFAPHQELPLLRTADTPGTYEAESSVPSASTSPTVLPDLEASMNAELATNSRKISYTKKFETINIAAAAALADSGRYDHATFRGHPVNDVLRSFIKRAVPDSSGMLVALKSGGGSL